MAGQPVDAMLSGHVGALVGRRHEAVGGSDVDDSPTAALLHAGQHRARRVEHRGEVDRDHPIPLLGREILDRRDMLDARIGEDDIGCAEFGGAPGDHRGDLIGPAHVGGIVERGRAA